MTSGQHRGNVSAGRLWERGTFELEQVGIPEARFQAELLLRHALGCSRASLLARLHDPVPPEASGHFFQLVERRRGREPVQYVIGSQEFYGLDFRVTPAVLIPRPETEGVVEQTLRELEGKSTPRIVDVGCGSGCVAIALARALPDATLVAIDGSPAALAIARENALEHGVADRIEFIEGDLLEPVASMTSDPVREVDAVASNPPYIPEDELASLEPEVSEHEPLEALSGGEDGLTTIRRLVGAAASVLGTGAVLVMEIGHDQNERVKKVVAQSGLEHVRTEADLAGIPRVVVARKP